MLILNEKDILKTVNPIELLKTIENAFIIQEKGDFIMPNRMHLAMKKNELLLMPCYSGNFFSTKVVSVFPENVRLKKQAVSGALVLNDGMNGDPLAMINGAQLTALRTGAVGGLGIAYTTPKTAETLGLFGAGIQGFHQVLFASLVRPIKQVIIYDPKLSDPKSTLKRFKKQLPNCEIKFAKRSLDVLKYSEIIIAASSSKKPVIPDRPEFFTSKHFIGIGSYQPTSREFPPGLLQSVKQIYIDTPFACEESGDLAIPIGEGIIQKNKIKTLGKAILGKTIIDTKHATFFKSVGMALFDLEVAKLIYKSAMEKGIGKTVKF
ncbi:MAG: ornithine cyclodeaminase family protein [Bacteroidales bacterium]|nr:ornithine cyclodeaminase family protein [Bacteroidales bacterium]MCF8402770.1 ornithine cyclodeaminase family protein [Bacteroidales bacterium]